MKIMDKSFVSRTALQHILRNIAHTGCHLVSEGDSLEMCEEASRIGFKGNHLTKSAGS